MFHVVVVLSVVVGAPSYLVGGVRIATGPAGTLVDGEPSDTLLLPIIHYMYQTPATIARPLQQLSLHQQQPQPQHQPQHQPPPASPPLPHAAAFFTAGPQGFNANASLVLPLLSDLQHLGIAELLGWGGIGSNRTEPLIDTVTTVRVLGGWKATNAGGASRQSPLATKNLLEDTDGL